MEDNNTNIEAQKDEQIQFESRIDLSALKEQVDAIRAELAKAIVGQSELIDMLIISILANGHALIEGVPGIAKTMVAKLLAKTLSVDFSRIQFTPDLMPSDILGTSVFNLKTTEFDFKKGPIFSNLILIDEINRAPAKTQAALFEVMEERQISIDGMFYKMDFPFLVLATQNPIEQEGTYKLPEAQLDRFLFKIEVDYPNVEEELRIIELFNQNKVEELAKNVQALINADQIKSFQEQVQSIFIEEHLMKYIAQIVSNTRENPMLYLGASPRASLSILQASKALAAMQGRDFVTPEDIKYVAVPALHHRVIVTPEREMEGVTSKQVIKQLLETIEIPR
jgi:MoxR-like ATPase